MDKTYRKIAFSTVAVVLIVIFAYGSYISGASFDSFIGLMSKTRFWWVIISIAVVVTLSLIVGRYFNRRWLIMEQKAVTHEKYITSGGISGFFTFIPYSFLAFVIPPYFIAPLYLVGALFPGLRDSVLAHGEMFILLPGNWFWWISLFIFWIVLGMSFGSVLFKFRNKGDILKPFGNSGCILVMLSEILVGLCIFVVARVIL